MLCSSFVKLLNQGCLLGSRSASSCNSAKHVAIMGSVDAGLQYGFYIAAVLARCVCLYPDILPTLFSKPPAKFSAKGAVYITGVTATSTNFKRDGHCLIRHWYSPIHSDRRSAGLARASPWAS